MVLFWLIKNIKYSAIGRSAKDESNDLSIMLDQLFTVFDTFQWNITLKFNEIWSTVNILATSCEKRSNHSIYYTFTMVPAYF